MPLTIKPIGNLSTNCWLSGNYDDYYHGPTYICWAPDGISAIRDDHGDEILYNYQGFIKTTKSLWVPGQHDCDNLQTFGTVLDCRFLPNMQSQSIRTLSGSLVDLTGFVWTYPGTTTTEFIPMSVFVEKYAFMLLPRTEYRGSLVSRVLCVTSTDKDIAWFTIDLDGTSAVGTQPFVYRYRSRFVNGKPYKITGNYYHAITTPNIKFDMAGATAILAEVQRLLVMTNWSSGRGMSEQPDGNPYFVGSANAVTLENLKHNYASDCPEWLSSLVSLTDGDYRSEFEELHYRAIQKIDTLKVNGLAYFKDLKNILTEFKNLFLLLKGDVTPKTVSSLYLNFKYGLPLTYQDTKSVVKCIKSIRRTGVSATDTISSKGFSIKCTSTIRYKPLDGRLEDTYRVLRHLDLLASPENLWDLVPFSFVVDWFVGLDDFFKWADQIDHVSHLNIDAVYDSSTCCGTIPASVCQMGLIGSIEFKRFNRHCSTDASFPLIVPKVSPSLTSHWLEGIALIIQRL